MNAFSSPAHRAVPTFRAAVLVATMLAVVLSLGSPAMAQWTFRRVATNTGQYVDLSSPPTLNNTGSVAFSAGLGGFDTAMVRKDGAQSTLIAAGPPDRPWDAFPSMNDAGRVSFRTEPGAIYSGDGGPLTTIADDSGPFVNWGFAFTTINDADMVAFYAEYDTGGYGHFIGDGGAPVTVADTVSGRFDALGFRPAINNLGQVAFYGDGDYPEPTGVYRWEAGSLTTIAEKPAWDAFGSVPSINDLGQVAFRGRIGSETGIYVGDGDTITQIAHSSELIGEFDFDPDINNHGLVAFEGTMINGLSGVCIGDADGWEMVVYLGMPLDNSYVVETEFRSGLNDAGRFAFQATLADGRQGIYLAIPEPTTLALLAFSVLLATRRRR